MLLGLFFFLSSDYCLLSGNSIFPILGIKFNICFWRFCIYGPGDVML